MRRTGTFSGLLPLAAVSWLGLGSVYGCHDAGPATPLDQAASANAALAVSLLSPVTQPWSDRLIATGNIEPWQLMSIGAEVSGVRVVAVLADVGDSVRKGQLLARLDDAAARVDLSMQQASLAEAHANLAQAELNLARAKKLAGVMSQQDLLQSETAAKTSAAKVAVAEAQIKGLQLKLRNTRIVAPDDGIVAARSTSVGSLIDGSSELFKLIRYGRVEWRAELRPEQQARVEIGQAVALRDPVGQIVAGQVRQIAPTADQVSRTSLVYVDVSPTRLLKPGVLATGEFLLSRRMALTIPHGAVVLRDGFNYALTVSRDGLVKPIKIQIGEQRGNDVEILAGLTPAVKVIASGVSFLHAGDKVQVVQDSSGKPAVAGSVISTVAAEAGEQ